MGLTQAELATLVGCAVITLRKIEAGERRPSRQIARLLAESLGVTREDRPSFVRFARGDYIADEPDWLSGRQKGAFWATPYFPRTNLPTQTTPLIGREEEIKTLCHRLQYTSTRLITLTGPPGVGKTSLGVQVATELVDYFEDGTYVVSLVPVSEPHLVAPTIIHALGLNETENIPPARRLIEFLRDKHMLLLLDNFEQVVTAAPLVADLLSKNSQSPDEMICA